MLSEARQDDVKQIHTLQARAGKAVTSALAETLGVSPASATAMLEKLAELGLAEHRRYHGAVLTPAGEQIAVEVARDHRLLELYLTQALGLGWDQVHQEAERLEHVLSDELEQSMDRALGFPDTDPRGDPIPSADLVLPPDRPERMVEMEPDRVAIVRRVPDGDPSLPRYLGGLGLAPTASFTVVAKAPLGGRLTLEVGGTRHAVGARLARQIRVEVAR